MKRVAIVLALLLVAVLTWLILRPPPPQPEANFADAPPARAPSAPSAPDPAPPAAVADATRAPKSTVTTPRAKRPATATPTATPTATATPTPTATPTATSASTEPAVPRVLTGAVSGVLRDETGRPVAGVRVLAVAAEGNDAGESITDDDGFYLVSLLRPGRYAVFVGLESAMASRFGVRGVDVAPGAVSRLDVDASRSGATVRVRAFAASGAPLPAQAILVAGPPGGPSSVRRILASDAIRLPELGDGGLVLTHVPPGVYTLVLLRGPGDPPVAAASPVRVGAEREIALDVRLPDDVS